MEKSLELVRQLVNDFRTHENAYLSPTYQELEVRHDFIDKFFMALGWDVNHERQKNPYEQEVHMENRVRAEGTQRRADYAFFIAPNFRDVKYFVEAKKPAHDLANPNYYYQTVRYGWNKTTPIAILTDFEEFHILDCRYKPDIKNALNYKIETFHYSQYTDEEIFKKIFYLFGRDAVAGGSLEKFAETLAKPRGKAGKKGIVRGKYQQVDEAFLELLDGYRDTLAHAFKNKNPQLDGESLTEAVQRTLDRLVFVRFLEDKGIEEQAIANLRPLPNPPLSKGREVSAWDKFLVLCRSMEPKYNGLVFKQHPVIDSTTFVAPDDKMFGEICGEISDPTSPYDFNTIPISILGSIYERFLGKIVTTTDKRAKVMEKPEVRKAGGVYYTPEYIVRYIVNETVGKLLYQDGHSERSEESDNVKEDSSSRHGSTSLTMTSGTQNDKMEVRKLKLTPAEVGKLKIIDIACGSGSFLLEVYSQLLDYHTRYYNEFPEKAKKGDIETREGKIVLSHKKRQEILVNNIYGVDIDFQATEVTQLSLYLKLMEDVTMNDAYQFSLLKERMLPDLRRNIVCGNSLIGRDILDGKLFDDETEHTLKPMNFEDAFPEIMNPSTRSGGGPVRRSPESRKLSGRDEGGFDVVVGNPPYLGFHLGAKEVKSYYRDHFETARGKYDQYMVFVEKAFSVLSNSGMFGYIIPNKFIHSNYGGAIKTFLNQFQLGVILDFRDIQVFTGATNYPCILVAEKKKPTQPFEYRVTTSIDASVIQYQAIQLDQKDWSGKNWSLTGKTESKVLSKLADHSKNLGSISITITQGLRTGHLESFFNGVNSDSIKYYKLERDLLRPVLHGKNVKRYSLHIDSQNDFILFPYEKDNKTPICIDHFPKTNLYLEQFKEELLNRKDSGKIFRNVGKQWFEYWDPKPICFTKPKIIFPDISKDNNFCIDEQGIGYLNTCYAIFLKPDINLKFVLGVLNSGITRFFMKSVSPSVRGGYFRYKTSYVERIPIYSVDLQNQADKARHDHIVSLVEQMLAAKAKHAAATTESEKNRLDIQIEALDRQIDEAVYELYGLTEEEIKIVEA